MTRLILLIAALLAAVIVWRMINNTPPEKKRALYWKLGLTATAAVLLLLAVSGRIHWVGAALAAGLALLRTASPYLIRAMPFLQRYMEQKQQPGQQSQQQSQQQPPHQHGNSGELNAEEALQILGLEAGASKQEVNSAHRRLIQKMHPDRGGSDYLAARINSARELLIKQLG